MVLAGGVGARMGLDLPKQLIKLRGRTLLEHSIARFDAHPEVERVIVMMVPSHLDEARAIAAAYAKVSDVLPGADTRSGTSRAALAAVPDDDAAVLLHDAVRPLVDDRIISDCFAALRRFDAVDVAIPSADTVVVVTETDGAEVIDHIPDRAVLRRGQTPQGFRAGLLREAYARAFADPDFTATDDCGVVVRYAPDTSVAVVAGSERNIKVTEPTDVLLAERLLALSAETDVRSEISRSHL